MATTQHFTEAVNTTERLERTLTTTDISAGEGNKAIHPYVQENIVNTNGRIYRSLVNRLPRYPIPDIPLPDARGHLLVDIGCGWGRWTIAAARKGYIAVGIDPWIEAVWAARDISKELGVPAQFVVADSRHLPFSTHSVDVAYSYSVLQHLSLEDLNATLEEMADILKSDGLALVEMPNKYGPMCVVRQMVRGLREPQGFEVRYWPPTKLVANFTARIGPTVLRADSFGFINGQPTDRDLLPQRYRLLITASERLRRVSNASGFKWLRKIADSVYLESRRARQHAIASDSTSGSPANEGQ